MKSFFLNLLLFFYLLIIGIYCDCNYITLGVDKEKCAVIKKQDEKNAFERSALFHPVFLLKYLFLNLVQFLIALFDPADFSEKQVELANITEVSSQLCSKKFPCKNSIEFILLKLNKCLFLLNFSPMVLS